MIQRSALAKELLAWLPSKKAASVSRHDDDDSDVKHSLSDIGLSVRGEIKERGNLESIRYRPVRLSSRYQWDITLILLTFLSRHSHPSLPFSLHHHHFLLRMNRPSFV